MLLRINSLLGAYLHFYYGNELFPIIISSGMLSLMSFLIEYAAFTFLFFWCWNRLAMGILFFFTIHHQKVSCKTCLSNKVKTDDTNPTSGMSTKLSQ